MLFKQSAGLLLGHLYKHYTESAEIKLTPRLCPAWCRGGKGGKCYRWGAPWGSTA